MIHVFVTLFNNGHLLPRCVESLAKQSMKFKCYVIDDCSTDDSVYIAESLAFPDSRFMVIRNDQKLYQEPPYDVYRLRSYNGVPSHLRTWKAFLWRRIPKDRIRTPQGEYWKAGGDLAFMYSMMEMASDKIGFIDKPIYCYDNTLPSCNHVKNPGLQKHNDFIIRNQKPLHPKIF